MPRPASLNYEMVAQAAKTLKDQGANSTISKVREVLGTGSLAVIGRHLKIWKAGGPSAADAAVTPAPAKAPQQKTLDIAPPAKSEPAKSETVETVEVVELKPVAEAPAKQEKADEQGGDNQRQDRQPRDKGRRLFNKRNNNNHHNKNRNRNNQHNHHHQNRERLGYEVELEEDPQPRHDEEPEFHSMESLEAMDRQALMKLVRRLESILYKEQVRREAADKMSHDAMQYAEVIKEQVAQRINDVRTSMQITVDQLKTEVKAANQQAEKDLLFYRQQLEKANKALLKD